MIASFASGDTGTGLDSIRERLITALETGEGLDEIIRTIRIIQSILIASRAYNLGKGLNKYNLGQGLKKYNLGKSLDKYNLGRTK